jgi:hypothetical protein
MLNIITAANGSELFVRKQYAALLSLVFTLIGGASAYSQDCIPDASAGASPLERRCWIMTPQLSSADLVSQGWELISSNTQEIELSDTNEYGLWEISYWKRNEDIVQCRNLYNRLRNYPQMIGSICYRVRQPT